MTANELANIVIENPSFIISLQNKCEMQEKEIKKLKYLLDIQNHSDNSLLKAVDKIKKQEQKIAELEKNLFMLQKHYDQLCEDCTCQGGHSEAYLKAKGR